MDIATLGIRIETQGAQQATTQLNQLDAAGKKVEQQAAKTSKAYQGTAKSAKELQMATRMLPMQFSDIAISLQAGQSPLQVLLQQGSQIKDSFGGAGIALRAMGGYVASLINPVTLAAGAVVGLAVAFSQLEDRQNAIDRALILTGQYSQGTADRLRELSRELDNISGVTAGSAARAIAEVAATGQFTADQLETVATAAETWRAATGTAVEDTVKQFAKLRNDPVKAVLELNRTYHFLTESTYAQIRALQEQGRDVDAATVAIEAYANAINSRAPQMAAQVGTIAGAFRGLKQEAAEAWDSVVEGLDRAAKRLRDESPGFFGTILRRLNGGTSQAAAAGGDPTAAMLRPLAGGSAIVDSDRAIADQEWQRNAVRYATDRQKLERDIAEARKLGTAAGKTEVEIQQRIAAIQADYARKNRSRGGTGAVDNAGFRAQMQSAQNALRVEQNAIQNANAILQAQYSARLVTVEAYYSEQRSLAQRAADAEAQSIREQIAILQTRTKTEKDSIDARREIGELETRLATVRADLTAKQAVLDIQEKANVERKTQARRAYADALDRSAEALADQMRNEVNRVFMSEREFEIQSRINDVYRERADQERDLAARLANREIEPDEYEQELELLQAVTDRKVKIVRTGYADMAAAQADWTNGATKAFKDYADEAANVAGQAYDIFRNAFTGLEDVLTDFITKGTADWKGFLDSIAADITRFIVRQQLSKWFESLGQSMAGGGGAQGGGWAQLLGSLFGGARAMGGTVDAQRAYLVGERGPELFVPGQSGYVNTAEQTRRMGRGVINQAMGAGGGGSMSVQQTFVIQGKLDRATRDHLARQTGREIESAMRKA